jgi:D-amino peptidase
MKIYISADMEGVAGIFLKEQLSRGTWEYAEARHWLTAEVSAAVAGCFEGGATEVVVKDAHSIGFNFVLHELDERAEVVAGSSMPERFPGLDDDFAGMILLAYHAMAGTQAAVCDHTMSTANWSRYELCGREVGEVGIDAALAGVDGVPVILVTGDDKVCAEARELLGPDLRTCQVKEGLARHAARTRTPAAACKLIHSAAREAVASGQFPAPYRPEPPYVVRLTYVLTSDADARRCDGERIKRLDGRTLEFRGDTVEQAILRSLRP